MTVRITISIPEGLEQYARLRVKYGGYGSISEYFRELVRIDQRFELAKREQRHAGETRPPQFARGPNGERY
jgi:Arc/MetJ-type ribon-helix-helix transcriptional regulator